MKIGNVELKNAIALAPMAGVTDLPFRLLCKEQGCGLMYTEMVSAKALCYNDKKTGALLRAACMMGVAASSGHRKKSRLRCSCLAQIRRL